MLLMACLVLGIVGLAVYIIKEARSRTPLTAEQATPLIAATLQRSDPAFIKFHTGHVKPSGDDRPENPNYRLLEKAGIVKVAKAEKGSAVITLTPEGEKLITGIAGFSKKEEADGAILWKVPLAGRQFVSVANIDMDGVNTAVVAYNWKWTPNPLGDDFDASGTLVKGFNLWERETLINKFNVDFYHGDPTRSTLALSRTDQGWKVGQ